MTKARGANKSNENDNAPGAVSTSGEKTLRQKIKENADLKLD